MILTGTDSGGSKFGFCGVRCDGAGSGGLERLFLCIMVISRKTHSEGIMKLLFQAVTAYGNHDECCEVYAN